MKLLVLDKDGTLTRTKSGHTFVQHPEDQVLIDVVTDAIAAYAADGWTMSIASNQGGVAAGFKSLDDAIAEMRYCLNLVNENYTMIGYGLFCPDSVGNDCWIVDQTRGKGQSLEEYDCFKKLKGTFRKPNSGMLDFWSDKYKFCDKKLMIGDRDEDRGAATRAGFEFMHVSDWLEPFVEVTA